MASFDVVSKVDLQEIDNALNQAMKEVNQRYDFKGTNTKISVNDDAFLIESTSDFKVKASWDVLLGKLVKRKVPVGAMDPGKIEPAAGARVRQRIAIKTGIDKETAKKIVKQIKGEKLKVQAAIQQDAVRVSGKKRDDLQKVIAFLKERDFGQPLQYENFRD